MTLKPKSSRPLEIFSAGVKVTDYRLYRFFGIWGEEKLMEILFLQIGFHS
jgi:hypothetical protein